MLSRRWGAAAIAALALLTAGCGGNDDDPPTAASSKESTTTAPPTSAPVSTTPTPHGTTPPVPPRPSTSAPNLPTTTTAAGPTTTTTIPEGGAFKSTVTVGKKCVEPGGTQTLTVETKPFAAVAWVMRYSDERAHDGHGGGAAQGDGEYNDKFIVPPDAPKGEAILQVSVNHREFGGSVTYTRFTVGC